MGSTDETGQSYQNIAFSFSPVAGTGGTADESQPGWQQEGRVRVPTAMDGPLGEQVPSPGTARRGSGGSGVGGAPHRGLRGPAN